MADLKKLREEWETAEAKAIQIQGEKDKAIDDVRAKYGEQQRNAGDDAAAKQKLFLDADAAQALADRDDLDDDGKRALADSLGLTLPE
jgi:hypothetical protein